MATSNDNLLKQLIETENSHDVEKVLTLLTDDIVFEDVTFGVVMKGKDGFKQIYPTFITAAPDFKLEPKAWVTDGGSHLLLKDSQGRSIAGRVSWDSHNNSAIFATELTNQLALLPTEYHTQHWHKDLGVLSICS